MLGVCACVCFLGGGIRNPWSGDRSFGARGRGPPPGKGRRVVARLCRIGLSQFNPGPFLPGIRPWPQRLSRSGVARATTSKSMTLARRRTNQRERERERESVPALRTPSPGVGVQPLHKPDPARGLPGIGPDGCPAAERGAGRYCTCGEWIPIGH